MVAKANRKEQKQEQLLQARRSIEARWMKFRSRLRRMYGPSVETRLIYLDKRWYEIRSCGWNPADSDIWKWWSEIHWPMQVRLQLMSRRCGMYAQSRKLWKNPCISSSL